jgi:hypothetical protein
MGDDVTVSKGLGFPAAALHGVGHMPAKGGDEQEAVRVFYVLATLAVQVLVVGVCGGCDAVTGVAILYCCAFC